MKAYIRQNYKKSPNKLPPDPKNRVNDPARDIEILEKRTKRPKMTLEKWQKSINFALEKSKITNNMVINRELDVFLKDFYEKDRKALLLTGARQTGKTFAIRKLGQTFDRFVEINFVETPEAVDLVKGAANASDLLLRISALSKEPLIKGRTLVFFDEVQKCPDIVSSIKFLVDEGSYRYALSGSLLGVELKDLRSEPVGYMVVKEVYPLKTMEFFSALGVSEQIMEHLKEAWQERREVDEFVHNQLMRLFRLYLLVGGMPAAVKKYLETNDLQSVKNEQQAILKLYRRDIAQYDPENKLYLDEILELIPSELNAKNKRFILKNLNENAKFSRYTNDFLWLKNAGVALPTYNVEEPKLPLLLARCRNLFKLFQNDVGLLISQYSNSIQAKVLSGDSALNIGAVYENVVAQELAAQGHQLYYFNSKKQGEVDFVIEYEDSVLPIEVKSGKDYERHNALSNILANENYGIEEALILHTGNLKVEGRRIYAPTYMAAFLEENEEGSNIVPPDLQGLT